MNRTQETGKEKIIVVTYAMGRIGSSALMGLFKLAGINIGKEEKIAGPAPMNPKGFFELKSHLKFLGQCYPPIYLEAADPPSLALVKKIGEKHFGEYQRYLLSEFGSQFPIAIKSQRFLTVPFFSHLKEIYDIKVVVMHRDEDQQADSIMRVWSRSRKPERRKATREFVVSWLGKWKEFSRQCMECFAFDYYHITFEELLENPQKVVKEIFNFIQEKCPSPQRITSWLDVSLVNRTKIQ